MFDKIIIIKIIKFYSKFTQYQGGDIIQFQRMQNNQPSKYHPSDPIANDNSIPPQQILYTQTFQCHCLQVFNTIGEYHLHITLDHHDNYLPSHPINSSNKPTNGNLHISEARQPNINQNVVINNQSQNEQQNNRLTENQYNVQISRWEENQNSGFANFFNHNEPPRNEQILNQQFQHLSQSNLAKAPTASQQQQKQIDFRYVKAYYQHKMSPFYRQFDIQPIHSQQAHQQKYTQSQQLKKMYQESPINPQDSLGNLRQNAFKDQRKIQLEFDARMLPIENAFIAFIQHFIQQNSKMIGQITPQKREAIPKTFFSKITNLQQLIISIHLKEMSQMSNKNEDEDFMQNDLFMSLNNFIQFLTQKLRFYEIWIIQTMAIIIFDTIIEYYTRNHAEMYENLKVSDFPYLYSNILLNTQSQKYELSFQISYLTMAQFLVYFNQWCSVFQYINNKKRVDFIEPLKNQIDQINEVYRDNVVKYRKITKHRKNTYVKRLKKKMIEKRRNEVVKRENDERGDLMKDYLKAKIVPNIKKRSNGIGYELIPNKITKVTDSSKYLPFSDFKYQKPINPVLQNEQFEIFKGPVNNLQDERRQFQERMGRTMVHEQKMRSPEQQNSRSNDQLNDYESDYESSREYVPKQSEYVNYFSQEKEEQRQKYEHDWNASLKLLRQITIDSQKFKPLMKDKVKQQLEQVFSLCSVIKFDSPFYYHLKKQMKGVLLRCSNQLLQNVQDNLPANQLFVQSIQPFNAEASPFKKDPFLVIKDYRYKNQFERREAENGVGQKGRKSHMELRSNYFIAQDQPQNHQDQYEKEDDPFDALI